MGHNDDREVSFQLGDQLFHLRRRNRIKGGAGFVHEQDLGTIRHRARDAETLHLASGKTECALMEAILHLVPEGRRAQGTLHGHIEYGAVFLPGDAERIDNVLVNRHREGVRLLEDHPDAAAQGDNLDRRVVDACPVDGDIPLVADTRDELVHPVEIPQ